MKNVIAALFAALLAGALPSTASADDQVGGSTTQVVHTGQGQPGGELDEEECGNGTGCLHRILTASRSASTQISFDGGVTWNDMYRHGKGAAAFHCESSWLGTLESLEDRVLGQYNGSGTGTAVQTISHGCPGEVYRS